ncbi:2,4-dihydroxyhept-2-ene-1,7-dioic acid aldolase [candidate division KSB3 bacterium]|uniref:2,4-dihydroxyhept-2-ene-1,7-dioic acid aldolase n=1 Tax=candidate division KSB3 bacterium TaxID=2044937 RepID=A0A9D5JW31_9BACT|nr:2,4-dihydroxyhept-2-ene-1,7-dioic acid aldolase [candidate division KSB3 bacterium]MBD3325352.1 2,4-dihydroxyhept-2-ene-1,7-dioic acid aldolase [candidate division KSB3 bacterium]
MLLTNQNYLKPLLRDGKKVIGAWAQAASNITAEILADAGFDLVMVDLEHGPGDILTLITQIQAMKGHQAVPFARAPWNDFVQIKRILDAGVYGLLVPYVNTKAQALEAVNAVKYPTEGIRGVAGSPRAGHYGNNSLEYINIANDEIILLTAIETPQAVQNLDEILEVDAIDGIFIGPMDLSTNMGHMGNPKHPEVVETIALIERKVQARQKFLATIAGSWEDAQQKYARGYQILLTLSDTTSLSKIARERVAEFTQAFPNR